jgi:hypothetical protein
MRSRAILAGLLLAAAAVAAPPLTTIQDVLYKADGTRFNGTLTITWNSFEAMDSSTIVTQSTSVKVVDGYLRVQLVPTTTSTPAVYYQVTYNSDGRIQFKETWSVPSSGQPVRVRDVRVATANLTTGGVAASDTTGTNPVQESDVTGLIADLSARPVKGPAYAGGRVALVNSSGAIESVTGSDADCVRVDGTAGPCGTPSPSFIDADVPAGVVDGANQSFSLSSIPEPASSLALFRNGLLQKAGFDFTVTGRTIQFLAGSAPQPGDTLLASYRLSDSGGQTPSIYPAAQVLCSGIGAVTNSTTMAGVGTCSIPSGTLIPGDRIEIQFDFEHAGSASGFSFEVHWGATTALHRDAAASDILATGRADAVILPAGAQLSTQSWGTVLPLAAAVASSSDVWSGGLTIGFSAKVDQSGDTLTLRNFAVVRLP